MVWYRYHTSYSCAIFFFFAILWFGTIPPYLYHTTPPFHTKTVSLSSRASNASTYGRMGFECRHLDSVVDVDVISPFCLKVNHLPQPFGSADATMKNSIPSESQPLYDQSHGSDQHQSPGCRKIPLMEWNDVGRASLLVPDGSVHSLPSPVGHVMQSIASFFHGFCAWASTKTGYPTDENETSSNRIPMLDCKKRGNMIQLLKTVGSLALLCLSVYLIMGAIVTRQTKVSQVAGPVVASIIMWFLIFWLGLMEGGQGSLVGLQPVDKALYSQSHPISHQCTVLAHEGENLHRFILGRQFLVFLLVFVVNMCSAPLPDTQIPGVPNAIVEVLLESGIATIFVTVILGQLAAEVNATKCMFDFINSHAMYFTLWLSLAIENSGLLHFVYLVQHAFSRISGHKISVKCSGSRLGRLWFWARVVCSTVLLSAACVITGVALFQGQTTLYKGFPKTLTVVALFILFGLIGMMEGMQIALFAVVNLPEEQLKYHHLARANCDMIFSGTNFQAFLIGRQVCVTFAVFALATMITIHVDTTPHSDGSRPLTVLGVSTATQEFLNSGLPGSLISTILASLTWRIIASTFPLVFMSSPVVSLSIRMCFTLEATGLFSSAWLCAAIHKQIVGFQTDDYYSGDCTAKKSSSYHPKGISDSDSDTECTDADLDSLRILRLNSTSSSFSSTSMVQYGATAA